MVAFERGRFRASPAHGGPTTHPCRAGSAVVLVVLVVLSSECRTHRTVRRGRGTKAAGSSLEGEPMGDCGHIAATGGSHLGEELADGNAGHLLGENERLADLRVLGHLPWLRRRIVVRVGQGSRSTPLMKDVDVPTDQPALVEDPAAAGRVGSLQPTQQLDHRGAFDPVIRAARRAASGASAYRRDGGVLWRRAFAELSGYRWRQRRGCVGRDGSRSLDDSSVRQDTNRLAQIVDYYGAVLASSGYFSSDQQTMVEYVPTRGCVRSTQPLVMSSPGCVAALFSCRCGRRRKPHRLAMRCPRPKIREAET
jgi:hypothetical protein